MAILFLDGFEQYVQGVDVGQLPTPPQHYKLGNGRDGVMFVNGDAKLMSFAGPGTRHKLKGKQ